MLMKHDIIGEVLVWCLHEHKQLLDDDGNDMGYLNL